MYIYPIFHVHTIGDSNHIYELVSIASTIDEAKSITECMIEDDIRRNTRIVPLLPSMTKENNYTYIGNDARKNDVYTGDTIFCGFVVEKWALDTIHPPYQTIRRI